MGVVMSFMDGKQIELIATNLACNSTLWFVFGRIGYPIIAVLFLMTIILFGLKFVSVENRKILLKWTWIIIITAALTLIFNQGMKMSFNRERYRAIIFSGDDLNSTFRPWYVLSWYGNNKIEIAGLNAIGNDVYKSFTSLHTAYAGISYTLMLLPLLFKQLNTKKHLSWCIVLPIILTGLVAFGRIIAGAHYMSDTVFGGTSSFVFTFVSYLIVNRLYKNHLHF
jgi:membrane-associated phospholipid phosphatase